MALSDLAGGRANSASQLRQEINCRVIDWAQCLQCDWLKQIGCLLLLLLQNLYSAQIQANSSQRRWTRVSK